MTPEARERALILVFPAIIVAVLYIWSFGRGAHQQLTRVERDLASARAKPPAAQQLREQQARVRHLSREIEQQQAEKSALQQQLDAALGRFTAARQRPGSLGDLTGLMHHHGLVLIEEAPVTTGPEVQLPASLKRLATQFATRPVEAQPQLWRIRFVGAYLQVLDLLDILADGEPIAIPLRLTMSETANNVNWRVWTLLVWI